MGTRALNDPENGFWQGRLAVRVESTPVRSFSAGFELSGNARAGELVLFTPFGSTFANLRWSPQAGLLRANGEVRQFDSLGELVQQVTGTDLPVAALFDWLAGNDVKVSGWQVDLQELPAGRLVAQRLSPEPKAELRVALDK